MKQIKYFSSFLLLLLQLNTAAQSLKGKMLVGNVKDEQFGRNVKISADGNILAVAAPLNSEHGDQNGRISVYAYNGNDWQMMGKEILPGKGEFRYGEIMELSADGRKLFAASPFGGVSIYTYSDSNWVKSEHTIQLESNNDHIKSISITPAADKIAVMFESDKLRRGCIKLFDYDGHGWVQDGNDLVPYPDEIVRRLSLSFSADGNQLAVGHYGKDTRRHKNAGEVIIYAKNAGEWKQQAPKFNGETSRANLGNEVLFSKNGNTIIASSAGSDLLDTNAGFVETYKLSGTEWTRLPSAIKPAKYNPWFAHAVSLSADGIIVAISAPYIGFAKPGYVKVYKIKSDGWKEIAMLTDVDGVEKTSSANNTVGWSIALSADGKTLAIGFPHNDENGDMAGKVMVYDLSGVIK